MIHGMNHSETDRDVSPAPGSPADSCLFCPARENLTDEHIFPAALGGEDAVHNGSCVPCNNGFSAKFEAEFNNGLKNLCYVLRIGNREREVPSIDAVALIDGRKFNVVLRPNGKCEIQDKKEERVSDSGKKVIDYFLFSDSSIRRLEERAEKRGQQLHGVDRDGRPIEFEPESYMPLDFIGEECALRTATKIALTAVAKLAGIRVAQSHAFDAVKRYILEGVGFPTRLFVNKRYAANLHIGPHQHAVQVYFDGAEHTVYAVVALFGSLTYLVELSASYDGADCGFTYAYDALQRKPTQVLHHILETERLATKDVRFGETRFDDVPLMADHWRETIESSLGAAARARG
jgi:hypothetical protein